MVLINRNYTLLWLGQTASAVGDMMFSVGILVWIGSVLFAGNPSAPVLSSAIMMIVAATAIVFGPVAGVFVERWDKQRVMLRTDLMRLAVMVLAGIALFAVGLDRLRSLSVWILIPLGLLVVAETIMSEFFFPARMVLIRDVVPETHFGRASGYAQTTQATAVILGPPVAAVLVVSLGMPSLLIINAATFVFSYLCVRAVRPDRVASLQEPVTIAEISNEITLSAEAADREQERRQNHEAKPTASGETSAVSSAEADSPTGFRREFVDGLSIIAAHPVLRAVVVLAGISATGIGALNALELYFIQTNLHGSAKWFGVISAGFGVGLIVGGLSGGWLGDRLGHSRVVWVSMTAFGVLYLVYTRQTTSWAGLVLNVLFGLALGALNSTVFPLLQQAVPRNYLARVGSVINPINQAGSLISISLAGVLAASLLGNLDTTIAGQRFTAYDTVLGVGAILCIAAGLYAGWAFRRVHPAPSTSVDRG